MGIAGEPTSEERERISELKALIYDGFERAIADGAPRQSCGVLVDEEFGAGIAGSARAKGVSLAMPVERSGQDEFDFEFGEEFAEHIAAFDPDFAKVLVRYNPAGDAELNRRQAKRLARLSEWLHAHNRKFLFELLVPATVTQLDQVAGDQHVYDRDVRPRSSCGRSRNSNGRASSRKSRRSSAWKRVRTASASSIRRKPASERTCGAWCSAAGRMSAALRTG